jgi:hypothetical protein
MKMKITRSTGDETLYVVSDTNRTRPMRAAELVSWLRRLRVAESQIEAVLDLGPAYSITLDFEDEAPGQIARAG